MSSKSRSHQPKEKNEENSLIFMLFAEIERLLKLLNERDPKNKNSNQEYKHEAAVKVEIEPCEVLQINPNFFLNK